MMGHPQQSHLAFSLTAQKAVYRSGLKRVRPCCFAITNSTQVKSTEGEEGGVSFSLSLSLSMRSCCHDRQVREKHKF